MFAVDSLKILLLFYIQKNQFQNNTISKKSVLVIFKNLTILFALISFLTRTHE